MPYDSNTDLPKSVRNSLPQEAQTIFRNAYNEAAKSHSDYDEEQLMKIAWAAVKRVYKKTGGKWVRAENMVIGAYVPSTNYDPTTHIVKAIKIGTIASSAKGDFLCTEDWLREHAKDWVGGRLIINHYGQDSEPHGDIVDSWFEDGFVWMRLANMSPETEQRMMMGENTGFSFDAVGDRDDPDSITGTNLSILFYPHKPACSSADGCGLVAETIVKTDGGDEYPASCYLYVPDPQKPSTWKLRVCEMVNGKHEITRDQLGRAAAALSSSGFRGNRVQLPKDEVAKIKAKLRSLYHRIGVETKDIPKQIMGSGTMGEKPYTDSEIEAIKAESAEVARKVATLEAEAKTHENEINAYKAEIAARNEKIEELKKTVETLFTAEDVEKRVEEVTATMFSAEDVEAAKKEAVEAAIAAEKERMDRVAAELDAVNRMFPEGLDPEFREEIVAMVKDGKTHEAIVKLGEIEYTSFKASVPTVAGGNTDTAEPTPPRVGSYDPRTKEWV